MSKATSHSKPARLTAQASQQLPPELLTGRLVSAARALLLMTQGELATACGVSTARITKFEVGMRRGAPDLRQRMRDHLEQRGIVFVVQDAEAVGVLLSRPLEHGPS